MWTNVGGLPNISITTESLKIALTRRDLELLLSESELAAGGLAGQAAWISEGLKVEESQ